MSNNPLVELSRDDTQDGFLPGGQARDTNDTQEDRPGIPYQLFTSFFNKKFEGLERRLKDSTVPKPEDQHVSWVFKGNKMQFGHNCDIIRRVEEAKRECEDRGDPDRCKQILDQITTEIRSRNKLIRIADCSPGGWATSGSYLRTISHLRIESTSLRDNGKMCVGRCEHSCSFTTGCFKTLPPPPIPGPSR